MATLLPLILVFLLSLIPRLVSPRLDVRGAPTVQSLFMAEELVRDFGKTINRDKLMKDTTASFPAVNFSCDGTITAWTAAGNFPKMARDSPQLGTCGQSCSDESFGASNQSEQLLCLDKMCVYRFTLEQPLRFVEGDIVAIRQLRKPLLEVFYSEGRQRRRRMSPAEDSVPFIAIDTDAEHCVHGTLMEEVVTSLLNLTKVERQQMLFPSLQFPLHGNITQVTVAGSQDNNNNRHPPELQVWRRDHVGGYQLISRGSIQLTEANMENGIFHILFTPPLQVSVGDVLGMFLPRSLEVVFVGNGSHTSYAWNTNSPYTQLDTGEAAQELQAVPILSVRVEGAPTPPVEEMEGSGSAGPVTSFKMNSVAASTTVSMATHTLALTTSAIMTFVSSATPSTTPVVPPPSSSATVTPLSSSASLSPSAATVTSLSPPAGTVTPSSLSTMTLSPSASVLLSPSTPSSRPLPPSPPPPTPTKPSHSAATGDNTLIVGVTAGSVAVAMVIILMVVIVAVVLWRRQRSKQRRSYEGRVTTLEHHLDNLLYSDEKFATAKSHAPQYAVIDHVIPQTALYDHTEPDSNPQPPDVYDHTHHDLCGHTHHKAQENNEREGNGYVITEDAVGRKGVPELPLWGLCVPTQEQRDSAEDHPYAVLEQPSTLEQSQDFFNESPTYWVPAANRSELYAQLAFRRYREIPRQQIQIVSHLGSGQFGTVNRAVWRRPGEEGVQEVAVAVKMLQPRATEEDSIRFLREAAINGQFRHPYVVQLFGVVTVGKPLMMVLELLTNGDLRSYLIQRRPPAGGSPSPDMPRQLCQFCLHVAMGMEYLGRKAFIHRDLAARNVLVTDNHVCKIADFGLSRELDAEAYYIAHGGEIPVKWTAPEALHYKKFSTASDVWSYGCLMYEIWSLGHKPFEGYSHAETLKVVDEGCRLAPPPGTPREVYRLMMSCWHPDRSSRPSFSDITETLSQPDHTLLVVACGDHSLHPLATTLGSPLKAGSDLHSDLQNLYLRH